MPTKRTPKTKAAARNKDAALLIILDLSREKGIPLSEIIARLKSPAPPPSDVPLSVFSAFVAN